MEKKGGGEREARESRRRKQRQDREQEKRDSVKNLSDGPITLGGHWSAGPDQLKLVV